MFSNFVSSKFFYCFKVLHNAMTINNIIVLTAHEIKSLMHSDSIMLMYCSTKLIDQL